MRVERFPTNPIIRMGMDSRLGNNINGPSLIRVPHWLPNPLGRYYLYFAHHRGEFIRLAYADHLEGPWSIYSPGTLSLDESTCYDHIASPDVHVDDKRKEIRMYFHGHAYANQEESDGIEQSFLEAGQWVTTQRSKVTVSTDGIHFKARPEILGAPYFQAFYRQGYVYCVAMPGVFYRSKDGLSDFEQGPWLFSTDLRHPCVYLRDHTLYVFFSSAGDCPERILCSTIDVRLDWTSWKPSKPVVVLEPEMEYEGVSLPLRPSERGPCNHPVRELRDPWVYEEEDQLSLLYSVAGEQGIGIARLYL